MKKKVFIGMIALVSILIISVIVYNKVIIPNRLEHEALVKEDIQTAEKIGRLLRIWSIGNLAREIPESAIEYSKLQDIESYIAIYEPVSLKSAHYYVLKKDKRIRIAIAKSDEEVNKLISNEIDYTGKKAGWAYIEGK